MSNALRVVQINSIGVNPSDVLLENGSFTQVAEDNSSHFSTDVLSTSSYSRRDKYDSALSVQGDLAAGIFLVLIGEL